MLPYTPLHHLLMRDLLTPEQTAKYVALRGYN